MRLFPLRKKKSKKLRTIINWNSYFIISLFHFYFISFYFCYIYLSKEWHACLGKINMHSGLGGNFTYEGSVIPYQTLFFINFKLLEIRRITSMFLENLFLRVQFLETPKAYRYNTMIICSSETFACWFLIFHFWPAKAISITIFLFVDQASAIRVDYPKTMIMQPFKSRFS